jgi:hypothetical protein
VVFQVVLEHFLLELETDVGHSTNREFDTAVPNGLLRRLSLRHLLRETSRSERLLEIRIRRFADAHGEPRAVDVLQRFHLMSHEVRQVAEPMEVKVVHDGTGGNRDVAEPVDDHGVAEQMLHGQTQLLCNKASQVPGRPGPEASVLRLENVVAFRTSPAMFDQEEEVLRQRRRDSE